MSTKTQSKPPVTGRGDLRERGDFTFPMKLIEGEHSQTESGAWRVSLVFERYDRGWSDGNGARKYAGGYSTDREGNPFGQGSVVDLTAATFEEVTGEGLNIFDNDSIAQFVGHSFMGKDEPELNADGTQRQYTDKNGKLRNAYFTVATEYLGDDYTYTGKVTIIDAENGGESDDSGDPAAELAELLDGEDLAELRNGKALKLVMESDLSEVKTILGKATRGGLVRPKAPLIDLLIEKGYGFDNEGTFVSGQPD